MVEKQSERDIMPDAHGTGNSDGDRPTAGKLFCGATRKNKKENKNT